MLLLSAQNEPLDDTYSIVTVGSLTPNKCNNYFPLALLSEGENVLTRKHKNLSEGSVSNMFVALFPLMWEHLRSQRSYSLLFNGNKFKPLKTLNSWGRSKFQ